MVTIGCLGFPVPATRYLREFPLCEVEETLLGVPGPALVRRWKREAPQDFLFTALAPKEMTAEGCKPSAAADAAWQNFLPVARDLDARAIVFTSPADLADSKLTRAAVRALFERLEDKALPTFVWEAPPSWELKAAEATLKGSGVLLARDPAKHPPLGKVPLGYYRLPGPAGYKSRYEDPTLEAAAKTIRETQAANTLVVFANVDRYADSKRLRRLLEE